MKNSVGISLQLWKKTCRCVEIQNRTCLVHEFKHDCTTVLSTTPIGNHASTYAHTKKKRLSKMNNKNVCWLTLSFTCSCICLQSTCCRQVRMCIDWWIFAMPYSFSCIFLRTWLMLIIPFISSCSQLLHAGEFSWMYLLITPPCYNNWQTMFNDIASYLNKYVAYLTLSLLLSK